MKGERKEGREVAGFPIGQYISSEFSPLNFSNESHQIGVTLLLFPFVDPKSTYFSDISVASLHNMTTRSEENCGRRWRRKIHHNYISIYILQSQPISHPSLNWNRRLRITRPSNKAVDVIDKRWGSVYLIYDILIHYSEKQVCEN